MSNFTLNGYQIKALMDFLCPDAGDVDQLESEVTIIYLDKHSTEEGEVSPAGYYAYCTEEPEEGLFYLSPEPDHE